MDPLEEFLANLNSSTPNYTPLDATEDPYVAPEPNATPYNTFADLPGTSYSPTLGANGIPVSQINYTPTQALIKDETARVANQFGIDPTVYSNLISTESNFNPEAQGPYIPKLDTHAEGPAQLLPSTADMLGVDDINDPMKNLYGGGRYFGQLMNRYHDPKLAAAAYNAGPGNVDKYGGIPPFQETRNYVDKVVGPELPIAPTFGSRREMPSPVDSLDLTSKYPDVNPDLPTTSRRETDLTNITKEITSLYDAKDSALRDLNKQGQLDPNDAIAIALTAIVPTLLGWATHGKQGAAGGATAGAAGANVGLAGLTAEQKRRDDINKLIYEEDKQRIATKENEANQIRSKIADTQDQTARDERLYGAGGIKQPASLQEFRDPLIISGLTKSPADRTQEENMAIAANPRAQQLDIQRQRNQNYGTSVANSTANLKLKQGQQEFQGYKAVPGAPVLPPAEINRLGMKQAGTITMIDNLEQQKDIIKQNGSLDITGTEAALEKALSADYMNLGRVKTNSGASYSETEQALVSALQAATAAGGSPVEAVMNLMTDRDPVAVINGIQSLLQRSLDADLISKGRYREGVQYSPTILKLLNISQDQLGGTPAPSATASPTATPSSTPQTVVKVVDGKNVTFVKGNDGKWRPQ